MALQVRSCGRSFAVLVGVWASVSSGLARAEVNVVPRISAAISHTDNLSLASGNKDSELVYQITPSISLEQTSAHLETLLEYQLENFYYAGRSDTETYHRLDLNSQVALDPENLFIEFGANRGQVIRNPSDPVAFGNLPISSNRTDRDAHYLGSSFAYPFASNVTARGGIRRTWIRYDEVSSFLDPFSVRGFKSDSLSLSFDNYREQHGLTWAVRYNGQRADYGMFLPWEYRQASVELGAWVSGGLRVFVVGGKESAWDEPFDSSLKDDFWEVGISKQAGERFSVELATGERTYGSSSRASLSIGLPNGRTTLAYSVSPTTTGRDPESGFQFADVPGSLIDRPGAIERYISERLSWSLGFEFRSVDVSLNIYDESRDQRFGLHGFPLPDEEQSGVGVDARAQLGVRTGVFASINRADRKYALVDPFLPSPIVGNTDSMFVAIGADYELGARTDLSLQIQRSREKPGNLDFGPQYSANLITLRITRTFQSVR